MKSILFQNLTQNKRLSIIVTITVAVCTLGASAKPVSLVDAKVMAPENSVVQRFGNSKTGDAPKKLRFNDRTFSIGEADIVVFAGQTDTVRSRRDGTLEALVTTRYASSKPRFRNMAWEGDTVYEQWRDLNFGTWTDQLNGVGATVVFAQFGQMEALDGVGKLDDFITFYEALLDQFEKRTQRIVVLSPRPFEQPLSPYVPDHRDKNDEVQQYSEAIATLANRRGYVFVDLFTPLRASSARLTANGIHLTPGAHPVVAAMIAKSLGVSESKPSDSLLDAIREKNRLWFDNWRPMNWAFAFGDRTTQPFGQPGGGRPALRVELEEFKPLINAADERIHQMALGKEVAITSAIVTSPHPVPPGDHSPGAELASFRIADGFDVNLFASEADGVVKPVQMRWDDRGRLWVICIPTYPHIDPGARPGDYILICEDTDGDGRADQFERFAEGLFIPMGLEFGNGGLYVTEATELVHLKDTDGDGKADQRTVILSGFGTADSHQVVNNLERGPAGDLWFTQGHHSYSRVETPWGVSPLSKSGVWRYRPRTGRLDGFFNMSSAGLNGQGVTHDDWGQTFHNSAAVSGGFYTVAGAIPTARVQPYWSLVNKPRRNTGIEFIGTQHLPEELQGRIVWAGYISNSIEVREVKEEDSGFQAEFLPDLIQSSRQEFRPVNVRVGPDGAIYVCDWYNLKIGHYQSSYRDPARDRTHGRIWRVTAKNRPLVKQPMMEDMTPSQLLDQLRSSERLTRRNAKQHLFDLPTDQAVAATDRWLAALDKNGLNYAQLLFEASGIYAAHETVRPDVLGRMLESTDYRVRSIGTRYIGRWANRLSDPLALLHRQIRDEHPRVRLEAIVASSYVRSANAIEVVAAAIESPRDRFINYAIGQAVDALKPLWRPAMLEGKLMFGNQVDHLQFILEQDSSGDVVKIVRQFVENTGRNAGREQALVLLTKVGNPEDLRLVLDRANNKPVVLLELLDAARVHRKIPTGDLATPLKAILKANEPGLHALGIVLAGAWRVDSLAGVVRKELGVSASSEDSRVAALNAAPSLLKSNALAAVKPFASEEQPSRVRNAAVAAMASLDIKVAAEAAVKLASVAQDFPEMNQLIAPVLTRQGGSDALAYALTQHNPTREVAELLKQTLHSSGRREPELLAVVRDALNISNVGTQPYNAQYVKGLAKKVISNGNSEQGRQIYTKLGTCAACHIIDDQGGDIGPELTIVGAGRSPELLIESVLWPNRQIREGYMTSRITTRDGEIFDGYIDKKTRDEIHLRDLGGFVTHKIAKRDVTTEEEVGSAMLPDLTAALSEPELVDLIRYLSELRK